MGNYAVVNAITYSSSTQFNAAALASYTVNGTSYGQYKTAGNLSWLRVFAAGHEVPYYRESTFILRLPLGVTSKLTGEYNRATGCAASVYSDHEERPFDFDLNRSKWLRLNPKCSNRRAYRVIATSNLKMSAFRRGDKIRFYFHDSLAGWHVFKR
jgi:hypothetical protein